jgi:hypothetical protein
LMTSGTFLMVLYASCVFEICFVIL